MTRPSSTRHLPALALLAALAALPFALGQDPYLLNALITTGIVTIAAMSLNLLLGFTGQLSLGHIAFFGIGAYVSALTSPGRRPSGSVSPCWRPPPAATSSDASPSGSAAPTS